MIRPVPSGPQVDAWWFDAGRTTLGPAELAELSAGERDRAAAFVFAADRHRYQAAHVALRRVLARYTGISPHDLSFRREPCPRCGGPSGRPVLTAAGPLAAVPWFSLSHTGDVVLVAVAGRPVGADAERDPGRCVCSLAGSMHPADAARVAGLTGQARHRAVIGWWVRAEAALKCAGEGITHRLGEFPVLPPATACPGPAPGGCELATVPAPPGCQAAVALAAPAPGLRVTIAGPLPGPAAGPPGTLGEGSERAARRQR